MSQSAGPTPTVHDIEAIRAQLAPYVCTTPVLHWRSACLDATLGDQTEVYAKLELFQHTGTFKPRGALAVLLNQPRARLERGVTAVSAGHHAIATAYAARALGTHAKVVMTRTANPYRVAACQRLGAELVFADDVAAAFERVRQIAQEEQRLFIHPFEGPFTALGTATVGLEFCRQVDDLDAVIIPIGGGGLCAGIATAVKLLQPGCRAYGVEPEGADSMHRSFAAGRPMAIETVSTIADSLGAPHAEPYSYRLCRQNVDELVLIDDDALRDAMLLLFGELKLAVEPAAAAATAALLGPLGERLRGKRIGIVVCGSNIDPDSFHAIVATQASGTGPLQGQKRH